MVPYAKSYFTGPRYKGARLYTIMCRALMIVLDGVKCIVIFAISQDMIYMQIQILKSAIIIFNCSILFYFIILWGWGVGGLVGVRVDTSCYWQQFC